MSAGNGGPLGLSPADYGRLQALARRVVFARGTALVEENAPQDRLLVIVSGFARVERQGSHSGVAIARLGPGETVGEMSLLEDAPASASVVAEDDVTADVIDRAALDALLERDALLAARFFRALAARLSSRLRGTSAQLAMLSAADVARAPRRRSVLTGHVTERQIPPELALAVAEFRAAMWQAEEQAMRGERHSLGDLVGAACDGLVMAMRRHMRDESLVEAAYDDLLAFRDPGETGTGFGAFVYRETFPVLMASATMARCHAKPAGYPDDPGTITRMLDPRPEGDGALGALVDAWFLARPLCRAQREVRRRITAMIGDAARSAPAAAVLALTARAPRELTDAMRSSPALRVTCLDGDREALEQASAGAPRGMTFVHANVLRLAQGSGAVALPPQQFIYALGLLDGLTDEDAVLVFDWVYERLAPGAAAVFSSFVDDHPDALLMEHLLEWQVIARPVRDLEALARASRFGGGETEQGEVLSLLKLVRPI